MNIGIVGYAFSASLFLLFSVLLLTSWRGRIEGTFLLIASVTSACWALTAVAFQIQESALTITTYQLFEIAKNLAWFSFLFRLLRTLKEAAGGTGGVLVYAPSIIVSVSAVLIGVELLAQSFPLVRSWGGTASLQLVGHLGFALAGLVLIEQLYRSTRPEMRWAVKYLYFGMGTLFAYDLFLYADALMFKQVDATLWQARGFTSALVVPFVAIAATRNPNWSVRVFVSRQVVFHATTLLVAGTYLVLMAAVGYYIRFYGGTWGKATQVVFVFTGVCFLAVALFSGTLRAKLKVFVNKHFFSYKYDWRDEWLRVVQTLSDGRGGDEIRTRVIQSISDSVDAGGGYLWMEDGNGRYQCTSRWQAPELDLAIEATGELVTYFSRSDWIIDIDELVSFPGRYDNLEIGKQLISVQDAWLIVPIKHHEDLIGFVLLIRPQSFRSINWEDRDLIKAAAKQAGSYLALLQTSEALSQANQFEAFNRLSAFVVHDLKNLIAQLELVAKNAERHRNNPAFMDDAVKTIGNAVNKMGRLLAQLRQGRFESTKTKQFFIEESVAQAVNELYVYSPKPNLTINDNFLKIIADKDRFTAVMIHMIKNAQEASAENGRVRVTVDRIDDNARIAIEDNGTGMDETFIKEKLFRPFQTTKGNAGMGIGVYETREYVNSLNGSLTVESEIGVGTKFTISIPLNSSTESYTSVLSHTNA
ncbi:MAG: PEP-CTERM system histidine kinase PrsK [Candidatus Thiodiazotropha sp. (ex Epidulcina cf. delphinae)]|nr:PEP-CTERM system histidine kinase PrsK [Candidatus Thiodiazotropha sp. (ex Epidulcina cf. delphinae)]